MIKIDSNYTCFELLDDDEFRKIKELYRTKRVYHYSTSENINNIVTSKTIWLTPFEKQKTELCYKPYRKGIYYVTSFSLEHIDFEILKVKRFKGNQNTDSELVIEMEDLYSFIDKDEGCIIVTQNDNKYHISFVNNSLKCKTSVSDEYLNRIFVRYFFVKVDYDIEGKNITNLKVEEEKKLVISSSVGKKVKSKFKFQKELKLVAELMSTKEIEIEDIKRIEFKFNKNVKFTQKYWVK